MDEISFKGEIPTLIGEFPVEVSIREAD